MSDPDRGPSEAGETTRTFKAEASVSFPLSGLALLLAGAGLAWYLLTPVPGQSVGSDALRDSEKRFAVAPPSGWEPALSKPCPAPQKKCSLLVLARDFGSGRFKAEMNLILLPGTPARATEANKEILAEKFFADLVIQSDHFKRESLRVLELDGLPALELAGSGPRRLGGADYGLTLGGALVPSRRGNLAFWYACDRLDKAECAKDFAAARDSLRVLNRPRRIDLLKGG